MNEEIVDEIYAVLVERFNIGEVFLPKYKKRTNNITWKQFIKAAIEFTTGSDLAYYCSYSNNDNFSESIKNKYRAIIVDKNRRLWYSYLYSLINKKQCSNCKNILEYSHFSKDLTRKDGIRHVCKKCESIDKKLYREQNKLTIVKYYQENKESILQKSKEYYLLNRLSILNNRRDYYIKNKYLFHNKNARYRATKLQATPNWANLITIKEIYRTCPPGYHVDHIVPLKGKLVCGLHCEFNLQHLPASENLSKGNRFEV
jgi:DNA-directed RNA polymerase subunit M/transcription elongation factor TFIIS